MIIGDGAFGNALYSILQKKTSDVSIWDKKAPLQYADILILAIPVQAVRSVLEHIQPLKKGVMIINSAKGIEEHTHLLPYGITKEVCRENFDYFALMGPSFAKEVVQEMPTLVNIGSASREQAKDIQQLFQTDYFRVRLVDSVEALELSGALKNVYAILCGVARGLGFGENTQAKLIALALEEMQSLCLAMGHTIDHAAVPGIIGDLILTCSSSESRNYQFGKYLVTYPAEEALRRVGKTVEGYYTVASLKYFQQKTKVSLPLGTLVAKIIELNDPKEIQNLFTTFIKQV